MPAARERILGCLANLECEEDVRILFACESGSRAWGFPSEDSDYDVRFLYVHPRDWYLSIDLERRRDVIERPIVEDLDLCGWDLRKGLPLLRKSNPPLLEWLASPIVYLDREDLTGRLRVAASAFYSPAACAFHYLHMARGNVREYLGGEQVWIKKYFYVLRPLLAIRWIESRDEPVPVEFTALLDGADLDAAVRRRIDTLLADKRAGNELDRGPKIPEIGDFIERELARLEQLRIERRRPECDLAGLDDLFRAFLTSPHPGAPPRPTGVGGHDHSA